MNGKIMFARQEYIEQFGEDPIDMFGSDWANILLNFNS